MKPRSLTVFVQRRGGVFIADTTHAQGISLDSATLAARRAAAQELEVAESEIELLPDGEHVMIATVRKPAKRGTNVLEVTLAICGGLLATLIAAALLWLARGGAS